MRLCLVLLALAIPAVSMDCDKSRWHDSRRGGFCEIREQSFPFTGRLDVDGGQNGGISIKAANRQDVLVRAQVQVSATSDETARGFAQQIRVDGSGSHIRALGVNVNGVTWAVSYEILMPARADLSLTTLNGGISVDGIAGRIAFTAVNGGVHLSRLAGDVEGRTTNGGLTVELAGARWEGQRLDVRTANGGVTLRIPEQYSAHVETGTVNGGVQTDFPVPVPAPVQGEPGKHLSFDVGSGGSLVRVVTTNGGVRIRRG